MATTSLKRRRFQLEECEPRLCLATILFNPHEVARDVLDIAFVEISAADMDGDGDADVISSNSREGVARWYENVDGGGLFGDPKVIFEEFGASPVSATDFNNDGSVDIIAAFSDRLDFYTNVGGLGRFGNAAAVDTYSKGPFDIIAADVDDDGDMDLVALWFNDNRLAWYENRDGKGTFGTQLVIDRAHGISVEVADLDGDLDLDVIASSIGDRTVAWYENVDGHGAFGGQRIISNVRQNTVVGGDLDGDDDMDVLSASQGQIAWHDNVDGAGHSWKETVISTRDGSIGLFAADIDGDGDQDVVSGFIVTTGFQTTEVAWFENIDSQGSVWQEHVVKTAQHNSSSVSLTVEDMDGDGDIDIVSASLEDNAISWYENVSVQRAPGDANGDLQFDQKDIVEVLQASKYLSNTPASFAEGDWNGDSVFDQLDIVAALETENYLQGPYAAADSVFAVAGE